MSTSSIDIQAFFQTINPARALELAEEGDRRYYIDFSPVRGGEVIRKLKNRIAKLSPNTPTCSLFTGHIGCGKSTELLRLKLELETDGFFVVYFESTEDLELTDVDIIDVLLVIARQITQQLDVLKIKEPKGFKTLLRQAADVLQTEIEIGATAQVPGVGSVSASTETGALAVETAMGAVSASLEEGLSISAGIGAITVKAKNDSGLRKRLNQYLGPQKTELLRLINTELIEPAIEELKQKGHQGLVVIVDNLDRIDNRAKFADKPQQEYLFVDQGDVLNRLNCHVIYTMPLALRFSNEYGNLLQRFSRPHFLPMVPVTYRNGREHGEGIALLKQMVLSRVFPDASEDERLARITELFESEQVLHDLCCISGGHVRDVLRLLREWVEEGELPLTRSRLADVVLNNASEIQLRISAAEWEKLRQVKATKQVSDEAGYDELIRSRMVFEYQEGKQSWFDINPLLANAASLQAPSPDSTRSE